MLLDIAAPPTAANMAIHLHPSDNIAVARVPIAAGTPLRVAGTDVVALEPVPAGHKIAVRAIAPGEMVVRYGQAIGRASAAIEPGRHVHTHNVAYEELDLVYEFPEGEIALPAPRPDAPQFMGYARDDGRAGTRNYIAVVAASNCAAHAAELIARDWEGRPLPENVDGVVAFPHGEGCAHAPGPDLEQLRRTIGGVLRHPNVSAALILGVGCEANQIGAYLGSGRVDGLTLQADGGTRGIVEAAHAHIARYVERAAEEERVPLPASKIVLGLNCGGSDSFSGITANPALGHCSDLLAEAGGAAVLAETTEIFGAEHLLVKRARNRATAEKLLATIAAYKRYLKRFEGSFDDNPSPGNKEGGLTNIVEKSLGAVAKSGTSPLNAVYEYAERITAPGFVFMNTPGYDPASLAGLAAGGCNVIAFTTGRGTGIGFPTIPVIKIATNSSIFRAMRDNMDINAGAIADGQSTVAEVGRQIFDMLFQVASGARVAAERLGHREFVPWRIGPVM